MSKKPHLVCVWNRDWFVNALMPNPLYQSGKVGAAYRADRKTTAQDYAVDEAPNMQDAG